MPSNVSFNEKYKNKCNKYGIGLVKFNGKDFLIVVEPRYHELWDMNYKSTINMVDKIKGGKN